MKTPDTKELARRVVGAVLHRGVRATMTGKKTFQLAFEQDQDTTLALFAFLLEHDYQPEEALALMQKEKQRQIENVRSIVARTAKDYSPSQSDSKWLIVVFAACLLVFAYMSFTEVFPLWVLSLAGVFFLGLIWLMWSPQQEKMNAIWLESAPAQEKLNRMLEVGRESQLSYVWQNKPTGLIALAVAAVLFIIAPVSVSVVGTIRELSYHSAITADALPLEMTQSTGDKFVLYDTEKERYLYYDAMPAEYRAETAGEVAGVLKISTEKRKVGTYRGAGNAYQYFVTVELYDCATGEVFARTTIEGGDPPQTIRVKSTTALFGGGHGYGKKPSKEEISTACVRLIRAYLEQQ